MKFKIRKLEIKKDSRGWLSEIIQPKDIDHSKFGLLLITTAKPKQIKGNHYHKRKTEWYCVIKGRGLLRIWKRNHSKKIELEIGEKNMVLVEIPKNHFHSIESLGKNDMYLLSYVSESFNPSDPDTYYE